MLTKEQIKQYLDGHGNRCPYCNSTNIDGGITRYECDDPTQEVDCLDCKKCWTDILGPIGLIEEGEVDEEVA